MLNQSIAKRYASALLDLVEQDRDDLAEKLMQFSDLVKENKSLLQVLANPGFSQVERKQVLDRLLERLGWEAPLPRFLHLLVERHRVEYLDAIAKSFRDLVDKREGRVRVLVESASELDTKTEAELKRILAEALGKNIIMQGRINPELIAGIAVRIGGLVIDGSLRRQLERLRENLAQERN
ncbi:MAG: ATP synthase F1 subunit delta [Deltaproteobacteria bacterium]|nr:ATP synthase F1 subunit delta [Deltaproteobacteria bacterium]